MVQKTMNKAPTNVCKTSVWISEVTEVYYSGNLRNSEICNK